MLGAAQSGADDQGLEGVARVLAEEFDAKPQPQRSSLNLVQHDAWVVAETLLLGGRADVAAWMAQTVEPPHERADLLRYVANPGSPELRSRIQAAISAETAPQAAKGRADTLASLWRELGDTGLPPCVSCVSLMWVVAREQAAARDSGAAERTAAAGADLAHRLGWGRAELGLALLLAQVHEEGGKWSEALAALERVEPIVRRYDALPLASDVLVELAHVHFTLGHVGEVARLQRDILRLPAATARAESCLAVSNLGLVQLSRGQLAAAMASHSRALEMLDPGAPPAYRLEIRQRMAGVMEFAGRLAPALKVYEDVLHEHALLEMPDAWGEAVTCANASRALALMGRAARSAELLDRAEQLFARQGLADDVLRVRICRAWYSSMGTPDREAMQAIAARLAEQGAALAPDVVVRAHCALARCYRALRQPAEALSHEESAAAALVDVDPEDTLHVDLHGTMGLTLAQAGRWKEALRAFDRFVVGALQTVDGMEAGVGLTFRGLMAREALQAAVGHALTTADLGALWRYLEAGRGLRLLGALGGRSALGDAMLPATLAGQLQQARARSLTARRDLALARADPAADRAVRRALDAGVRIADEEREAVAREVDLARRNLIPPELSSPQQLTTLDALRARLGPGEALVSMALGLDADSLVVLVASRDVAHAAAYPIASKLSDLAARIRTRANQASDPKLADEERALARQALTHAMDEATAVLLPAIRLPPSITSLVVIPDGGLAYLPYAALLPGLQVTVSPSGSVYQRLLKFRDRLGEETLAIGGADYSGRSLASDMEIRGMLAGSQDVTRSRRWRPLLHAREEVEAAAGATGVSLLGGAATSMRFLEALSAHPNRWWRSIHFACHGLIDPDDPSLSGLVLSDGLLTALEVFPMRLNSDVAVLSACETGTDSGAMGEGIAGLVHAFLHAGTPRVLASLWQVPDDATALLMKRFYELLADPSMQVVDALRDAQKFVRTTAGGRYTSPENWAAWTLWGVR